MKLQVKDKLVMIGDSITDCGRTRPVGEGLFSALGNGYVVQVDALLQTAYPERNVRVVNMGSSGDTVLNLEARWQTDVLDLQPDWLSIMIGINDVWRQYDMPFARESHVLIDQYEKTLDELIQRTRSSLKGLVLMTPFYIEPNPQDAIRATMDEYGQVVRKLADKYDAIYVDTQKAINKVLQHRYPAALAWDRVHPNAAGHMVLARAFLNALDFSWQGEHE